jgi:hypothetical protein
MRLVVAALVALFLFVPAAQAQVTFTDLPQSPTNRVTFDIGFEAPGAVRYDCVHVFPDGGTSSLPGCTSPFEFRDAVDGRHELQVTAFDGDGVPTAGSVAVVIDTVAPPVPVIVAPPDGKELNQTAVTLSGTTAADTTVAVFDGAAKLGDAPAQGETWTFDAKDLSQGPHTLTAVASDAAGNTAASGERHITVDTVAPMAVEPLQTGASEFSFAGEAGATFECSVDGAGFAPCTSPQSLAGLGIGEHSFAVRAVDAAGNRSDTTTKTFSIAPPPVVTPAATAAPAPTAVAATPTAALGRTLVARTVSGRVFVRRPATAALLDLGTVGGIPVGTEIDAREGRVRLTAAATRGRAAHRAEFFGGVFVVTQGADDVVDVQLSEPFGSCAKKTGTRLRRLWGDGNGRFRVHGLTAVVTVRGTRWLVQDSCEGTLTRVSQGVVSVRDTVKRKTVLVRAGRKYLAVPRKRK